jgi:hypothetical protein
VSEVRPHAWLLTPRGRAGERLRDVFYPAFGKWKRSVHRQGVLALDRLVAYMAEQADDAPVGRA